LGGRGGGVRESKSFPPYQWHGGPEICIVRNLPLPNVTETSTGLYFYVFYVFVYCVGYFIK